MIVELTEQEIGMILSALDHVPTVGLANFELAVAIKTKLMAGEHKDNELSGSYKAKRGRQ